MTAALKEIFATRTRRAALLICVAHAGFFFALFLSYFYLQAQAKIWPSPFHFASLLMVAAMAMFSVAGSVTAGISAWASRLEDREPAVRWMAIAISCWMMFLFLEIVEWIRLIFLLHLGADTTFGQLFLAITGAHWICVFVCILWLGITMAGRKWDVLAATLYSHFLNVVWLTIMVVLYFSNASLEGL